jgi:replicative DNA helicase
LGKALWEVARVKWKDPAPDFEDDIPAIKERLSIAEYLSRQGLKPETRPKPTNNGKRTWYLCPLHKEDSASFLVDAEGGKDGRGVWYCHGCEKGGDVIRLAEELEGVDTEEAINRCRAYAGLPTREVNTDGAKKAAKPPAKAPRSHVEATEGEEATPAPQKDAQALYDALPAIGPEGMAYLEARGIPKDTADLAGFRWIDAAACKAAGLPDSYGGRFAFPFRLGGRVVQVQARGLWPMGAKGKPPAAMNLPAEAFGPMDGLCGFLEASGPVVLCEAPLDALSVLVAFPSISAVAVGGGTGLQERAAAELAGRLVFFLADNDEAGKGHRVKWREALKDTAARVRDIHLPAAAKDANELLQADKATLRDVIGEALEARRRELFEDGRDYLREFAARPDPWPTGLPAVDMGLAGGLLPDHLYVLQGDTGSGKTALAHQLAQGMARGRRPVLYVSLEMGRYVLWARTISRLSAELMAAGKVGFRIPYLMLISAKGRTGEVAVEVAAIHARYRQEIAPSISVLEGREGTGGPAADTDGIRERAREIEEVVGLPPAVFVDYLQLIQPTEEERKGRLDVRLRMDNALASLRRLANEIHAPVCVITAKSRGAYGEATIAGGKESGGIEYTADFLLDLAPVLPAGLENTRENSKARQEAAQKALMEDTGPRILRVLKERDGRGSQTIRLTFHRSQGRFE